MKKTKTQRGITLIALIITIVVLMILAAVAISSIQNDNILSYANNAAIAYNQAQKNEQDILDGYLSYMPGNGGGASVEKAEVGTVVSTNSTINGSAYSSTNPVIPAGFKAIDTETAKWGETDAYKKGLVISDGTNEFVWIPVENINDMVNLAAEGGTDANGRTNYQGKLYNFSGTTATEMSNYGQGTTSYREPANLAGEENDPILSNWTATTYQESFNAMVESIIKYKGFYVGRYEMGFAGISKSGDDPFNNSSWPAMYETAKSYAESNTKLGVVSEMMWGCQRDAMYRFILTGPDGNRLANGSNVSVDLSSSYKTGGTNYSGSITYNDIVSNIYDLEGNMFERTQELAGDSYYRVERGTSYNTGIGDITARSSSGVYDNYDNLGTRISIYVKV